MADDARAQASDHTPTIASAKASVVPVEGEESSSPSAYRNRGRRLLRRIGLTLLAILGVLVALALLAYRFGSMEPPSAEVRARYDALVAAGKVPPLRGGFHVPIPGCRCHSGDPVVQMQHASIPIKDCTRCHGAGQPQEAPVSAGR